MPRAISGNLPRTRGGGGGSQSYRHWVPQWGPLTPVRSPVMAATPVRPALSTSCFPSSQGLARGLRYSFGALVWCSSQGWRGKDEVGVRRSLPNEVACTCRHVECALRFFRDMKYILKLSKYMNLQRALQRAVGCSCRRAEVLPSGVRQSLRSINTVLRASMKAKQSKATGRAEPRQRGRPLKRPVLGGIWAYQQDW